MCQFLVGGGGGGNVYICTEIVPETVSVTVRLIVVLFVMGCEYI